MRTHHTVVFIAALMATHAARAQSININFAGGFISGPSPSYAAAGLAGTWNIIPGTNGVHYLNLKRLSGASTSTEVLNIGGTQILTNNHPGTSGDDQNLLDHYLVTFNPNLEVCLFFEGLQDGTYEVITYAWLPDSPLIDSYVTVDYSGDPPSFVGGVWGGVHQEGVTYSVHRVEVSGGDLYSHSGIPPASGFVKAALNGVQLRKISPTNPLDVDGDGDLDLADFAAMVGCLGGPNGIGWRPHCPAFNADGDSDVDLADYARLQRAFGDGA